ncbi:hypothetical protein D1007_41993 [Hordeum vulgare]|nr:hypothetical protein D1007_41993 [Hordeum vulgare]
MPLWGCFLLLHAWLLFCLVAVRPWASDVCDLAGGSGGVRIHGSAHTVLVPPSIEYGGSNPNPQEWRVLPYSRKHMSGIKEITVRELPTPADAPRCAVTSQVPALVFATGRHRMILECT